MKITSLENNKHNALHPLETPCSPSTSSESTISTKKQEVLRTIIQVFTQNLGRELQQPSTSPDTMFTATALPTLNSLQTEIRKLAVMFLSLDKRDLKTGIHKLVAIKDPVTRFHTVITLLQGAIAQNLLNNDAVLQQIARLLRSIEADERIELSNSYIQEWGVDALLDLTRGLLTSPDVDIFENRTLMRFRKILGAILLTWGRRGFAEALPLLDDLFHPSNSTIDRVKRAHDTLGSVNVAHISDADALMDCVDHVQKELESGPRTLPQLDEKHKADALKALDAILYSSVLLTPDLGTDSTNGKKPYFTKARTTKLFSLIARAAVCKNLLGSLADFSKDNSSYLSWFPAHLLLGDDEALLEQQFADASTHSEAAAIMLTELVAVGEKACNNLPTKGIRQQIRNGLRYGFAVYALDQVGSICPKIEGSRYAKSLLSLAQRRLKDMVMRQSMHRPVPIRVGYRNTPSGHDMWMLVEGSMKPKRYTVRVINTGCEIETYHQSENHSPTGRRLFPQYVSSPQLTSLMFGRYFDTIVPLQSSGKLRQLMSSSNTRVSSDGVALRWHYTFGDKITGAAAKRTRQHDVDFKRKQRGPTCVVKGLKRVMNVIADDQAASDDLRFWVKGLAHVMWYPFLKAKGVEDQAKRACTQHITKLLMLKMMVQNVDSTTIARTLADLIRKKRPVSTTLVELVFSHIIDNGTAHNANRIIHTLFEVDPKHAFSLYVSYLKLDASDANKTQLAYHFWAFVCDRIDAEQLTPESLEDYFDVDLQMALEVPWTELFRKDPEFAERMVDLVNRWPEAVEFYEQLVSAQSLAANRELGTKRAIHESSIVMSGCDNKKHKPASSGDHSSKS